MTSKLLIRSRRIRGLIIKTAAELLQILGFIITISFSSLDLKCVGLLKK